MHSSWTTLTATGRACRLLAWSFLGIGVLVGGCRGSAVGDPCEPEQVPEGGFDPNEAYLETSSVQCRTRVCMVFKLQGDPSEDCNPATTVCPSETEVEQKVYCTCRCDRPDDAFGRTCSCPSGYSCVPVLDLGGAGIRGSYCCNNDDPACQEAAMEGS
jgi:hypothetical protein